MAEAVQVEYVSAAFPLMAAFLLTFVGIYVLKAGSLRLQNVVFAVLAFGIAALGLLDATLFLLSDQNAAWPWILRVSHWVSLALPLAYVYLALVFPYRSRGLGAAPVGWLPIVFGVGVLIALYESGLVSDCIRRIRLPEGTFCFETPLGHLGVAYAITSAVAGFLLMIAKSRGARTEIEKTRAGTVMSAFGMLVASTLIVPFIAFFGLLFGFIAQIVVWELTVAFAVIIAYAILKYQLFDVGGFFRRGVSYTFTFVALAITWVVLGELFEGVVGDLVFDATRFQMSDRTASILTAIAVFVLIGPVQNASSAVLLRLFPGLKKAQTEAEVNSRSLTIYRAALEEAWRDGEIRGREIQVLDRLRQALRITTDRHVVLENEVRRDLRGRASG